MWLQFHGYQVKPKGIINCYLGILKKEKNPEIDEDEENFDEAAKAVNTVIHKTRCYYILFREKNFI